MDKVALGVILSALIAFALSKTFSLGSRRKGLPPGPPTKWLIGNAHIFPKGNLHLAFAEWSKVYGDVISLQVFHQTIIVLNSPSAIREIIDKRNVASSNRPRTMIGERLVPNEANFGMSKLADEKWKACRKAANALLHSDNLKKFTNLQTAETHQLLWDFYHTPEDWFQNIHRFVVSFASIIIYGKRSPRVKSRDVAEFMAVHPQFMDAMNISAIVPVDIFPILDKVPEIFVKWKKQVKQVRKMHEALYGRLLGQVQDRLKLNIGNGCFMEDMILRGDKLGINDRDVLLNLGGVLLQGSDTTSVALQNIICCLVCYPDAQEKVYKEIEQVVGVDRPPHIDDLPNLPYTRAFIEESNRLRPLDPLALPHCMNQDEIVNGVLYPKGSVIFMNIWGLMHDERYFEDPYEFKPERFLSNSFGVRQDADDDPARRPNLMFGGGRRVCPGMPFAQLALGINTASLIWAFSFSPYRDPKSGKEILPDMSHYSVGVIASPKPVKLQITPRSQKHVDVIEKCFQETGGIFAPFEHELSNEDQQFNAKYRDLM
ncbi:hypothetical protein D9757_009758 [Collybiopsis confluens]|uniref:Cytochrome P450 n=1 Tax=Collybiopsis confluens TaxID=2823264 RepID=A0A8H5GYM2_9AGAR|nr:hypothetical protein D9757_009758 [Collybiopsis confluens]